MWIRKSRRITILHFLVLFHASCTLPFAFIERTSVDALQQAWERNSEPPVHLWNSWSTQGIKQSTKRHSLLKVAWFGNPGLKEKFILFSAGP